ncbi:hypothetical protein D8Y20_10960 [Mariprofundus sp. EBB-1]|uniref:hypothetical protein n=1 Tax=Mariprofundus sp. EBB-1 TaxID=2650971 RepID=UPI000EF1FB5C|nr:hypothetical protein [Mariprofundus sp. EBB-1]RLL50797.1 hypothetical protein D8Y20_10960 [Mariprofundus sp. EBB-1]
MHKLFVTVIGCMSLLVSGFAQAQMIQTGVSYPGNSQLELPGSGATFTVPSGWSGQYNPAEKLFEMYSPSGQQVAVGYEGKSYADAIAYAKQPITTSDGIVMTPMLNKSKKFNGKFSGEAFPYTGKALIFMDVGAVAFVIQTPNGKALTLSSGGLGTNLTAFSNQIGLVTPSLSFTGQNRTYAKSNQSSSQRSGSGLDMGAITGQVPSQSRSSNATTANTKSPKIKQAHKVNKPLVVKAGSWEGTGKRSVKYGKGNPFKGYGMGELPAFIDHSSSGLYLRKNEYGVNSGFSDDLNVMIFEHENTRVFFCAKDRQDNNYRGSYNVERKINGKWEYVGTGNYQIYSTMPPASWPPSDRTLRSHDMMILDRAKGPTEAIKVKMTDQGEDFWWDTHVSFNGIKFSSVGVAEYCGYDSYGGAESESFFKESSRAQASRRSSRASSSSGSYDTHFGTTSSGQIIFSSPQGSMSVD